MNIQIQQKVTRLIELSQVFSKTSEEIFGEVEHNSVTLNLSGSNYMIAGVGGTVCWQDMPSLTIDGREIIISDDGTLRAKDNTPLTRGQEILLEAEVKAKLSNDFDEYITLQKDLSEYFKISNKLTQE